jgi:hypothetical protein
MKSQPSMLSPHPQGIPSARECLPSPSRLSESRSMPRPRLKSDAGVHGVGLGQSVGYVLVGLCVLGACLFTLLGREQSRGRHSDEANRARPGVPVADLGG